MNESVWFPLSTIWNRRMWSLLDQSSLGPSPNWEARSRSGICSPIYFMRCPCTLKWRIFFWACELICNSAWVFLKSVSRYMSYVCSSKLFETFLYCRANMPRFTKQTGRRVWVDEKLWAFQEYAARRQNLSFLTSSSSCRLSSHQNGCNRIEISVES